MKPLMFPPAALIAFAAVLLAACGCRTSYQEALAARQDVVTGTGAYARERAGNMARSTVNRRLGTFELGRLKMLEGDFAGSSALMAPLLDELFDETNEGPVLKKEQIAGNILAGTVADDRAIAYELPPFELLLGLEYQALNSLYLGKKDNARVYLRRATAMQEQLKEEKGGDEVNASATTNNTADAKNIAKAQAEITGKLTPVADTVRASYENALVWYLMGVFFEKENDASNAAIAYGEAVKINPGVKPFVASPAGEGTEVIVVYEENLVDIQEPIKIPLPFGGTLWSVDFPVYRAPPYPPASVAVEAGGTLRASCVPAVNVQGLAYRNLRDRLPGVVTRNVTRAAVKIAAQQAANHIRTGDNTADALIMLGVLAYNVTSTVITEADTRCVQTVPEYVHLARFRLPADQKSLTLRNAKNGKALEIPVTAAPGGTRLVWITDTGGYATVGDMPLAGGGAPTWARTTSLLNGTNMPISRKE